MQKRTINQKQTGGGAKIDFRHYPVKNLKTGEIEEIDLIEILKKSHDLQIPTEEELKQYGIIKRKTKIK